MEMYQTEEHTFQEEQLGLRRVSDVLSEHVQHATFGFGYLLILWNGLPQLIRRSFPSFNEGSGVLPQCGGMGAQRCTVFLQRRTNDPDLLDSLGEESGHLQKRPLASAIVQRVGSKEVQVVALPLRGVYPRLNLGEGEGLLEIIGGRRYWCVLHGSRQNPCDSSPYLLNTTGLRNPRQTTPR